MHHCSGKFLLYFLTPFAICSSSSLCFIIYLQNLHASLSVHAEGPYIGGKRCHLNFITSFSLLHKKYGFFACMSPLVIFTLVYNPRYQLTWKCLKYLAIIVNTFLLILVFSQIISIIVFKFIMVILVIFCKIFIKHLPVGSPTSDKSLSEEENIFCNLEIV